MRIVPLSIAASLLFALSAAATANAQDQDIATHQHEYDGTGNFGHAENHDWYKDLTQPGTGYSCCNGSVNGVEGDCRPTRAYLQEDGVWRAMVNGHWVPVPPRVVLKSLAPDGNSHICAGKSGMIYCFIGGSPKS